MGCGNVPRTPCVGVEHARSHGPGPHLRLRLRLRGQDAPQRQGREREQRQGGRPRSEPPPQGGPARSADAQPRHDAPRRLSALGSRLSLFLSALAAACEGPLRPSTCRRHAPRGTPPSHSRGRYPRLHRGHRPSAARRGIGPSPPPGGRAVSRPTRPWCAVTASLVAYPAGRSHRLNRVRAHRRGSPFHAGNIIQRNSTKTNSYNFTTSIGIPRTACKFDEYQPSRSD